MVVEDALVERAFAEKRHAGPVLLAEVDDRVAYHDGVTDAARMDATAAAGLARAFGVPPEAAQYPKLYLAHHRRAVISHAADVTWIDDSKATNAHAAVAAVWNYSWHCGCGSQEEIMKGQEFGDPVSSVAPLRVG